MSFTFSEFFDLSIFEAELPGSFVEVAPTQIVLGSDGTKQGLRAVVENEKDLICLTGYEEAAWGISWNWQAQRVGQIVNSEGPPTPVSYTQDYTASLNSNIIQIGFPAPFAFSQNQGSKDFNPDLHTALQIELYDFRSNDSAYTNNATEAQLKLLGKTVATIPLGTQFDAPGHTLSLTECVVEPSEYFEYDPGDGGGPIYDKFTGRQLRSQFA